MIIMTKIMKKLLRLLEAIIAIILAILVLTAILVAIPYKGTAKNVEAVGDTSIVNTVTENNGETYPFIFVHGMTGWGEDAKMSESMYYWGFSDGLNLMAELREDGYEAYAPSVGPMSSAYDRACELYAQLTGTRVDYGEAHSKEYGHERYGRDYTGQALMGDAWDLTTKINLIGHSFGGPTIRVFASLMAYGSTAEVEASGDDCSELFKGGHADCINAVVTLASPSNGSTIANVLNNTPLALIATVAVNVLSNDKYSYDPMLEQFGVTGEFDLWNDIKLALNKDHCGYDMTINGAEVLNKKYPTADSIYYISYTADLETEDGTINSQSFLGISNKIINFLSKVPVDGHIMGTEWAANDGLVPVPSARYPSDAEDNYINEGEGEITRGTWYCMNTDKGQNHGYYCAPAGEENEELVTRTEKIMDMVNSLD